MKHFKLLTTFLLFAFLVTVPITVNATSIGDTANGNSGTDPGGSGGGGGGSGEGGGSSSSGPYVPELPNELLVTPRVTALHSLNALLATAEDGQSLGVYFIPSLEDFPTSLKDSASCVVDYNNVEHRFAVVYDGYFNTEVEYVVATNLAADTGEVGRLQTSKKVYSSVDNTRTLNLLGYDLLLSNEEVQVTTAGTHVSATYQPTLVGTQPLSANTVVMDLYKALGEYEWDIRFVWVEDKELALDTSPLQSEIGVAISDKYPEGIDTSEGATYVWATRTNPMLYWDKVRKDAVFDGGAHTVTSSATSAYIGSDVSVTFSKAQNDSVTFGEFCAIARAMMDLYGEPVMTAQEQLIMIQNYGLSLPDCNNKEIYDSICYLSAKGIINPQECDLSKAVTFADIEPILVRIADEGSRLTFKESSYNPNSVLFKNGYVSATTTLSEGLLESVDKVNSNTTTRYNDFFVECDDSLTNFILTDETGEEVFAADAILCNGYASASTDYWYSPDASLGEVYPFEFKGIKNNFYHFKIAEDVGSITISYDLDYARGGYTLNRDSYTIPDSGGGVYLVENGNFTHYTLDEAAGKTYTTIVDDEEVTLALPEYSLAYIDSDRRNDSEINEMADFGFMSTYNWVYVTLDDSAKVNLGSYKYDGVSLQDLAAMVSGDTIRLQNGADTIYVKYITSTKNNQPQHTYIFQVDCDLEEFKRKLTISCSYEAATNNAYFCPDDNSVLVSYEYLKTKGLVSSMQNLSSGNGKVLTLSKLNNTNVILRQDLGLVIVGSTVYKTDEMLYYEAAGVMYINYRACLGWTSDYLILNNGNQLQLTNATQSSKVKPKSMTVQTFYPDSSVGIPAIAYGGTTYIPMYGLNPLGNYIVVIDESGSNTDYVFVWKRKEYAPPGNSTIKSYGDDSGARDKFRDLTGVSLGGSDDYVLMSSSLHHENVSGSDGNYKWITYSYQCENGVIANNVVGWCYKPKEYSDWGDAANAYLDAENGSLLPIANINGSLVNLNLNMYSVTPIDDVLPYGQMPYKYKSSITNTARLRDSSSKANTICEITGMRTYKDVSATYDSLSDGVIHPAPIGMFSELYGLPEVTVAQVANKTRSLYYGSQLLEVAKSGSDLTLVLGPSKCLVSDNPDSQIKTLAIGSGTSGIYSFGNESLGINTVANEKLTNVDTIVTDPNELIDWEQFKFRRLVQKLDRWSTVALIFALNVLPRLAMMLFFIIIILTCIKNWKPWIKFNNSVFDVYSFLTFGRLNVNTVSTGRVVFHSMMALAVFGMIMDGALFNFIMWVSKFILVAMQR